MTLVEAIAGAEAILPGEASERGLDPRWQAIVEVAEFIQSDPEEVWAFAARWGCAADSDLRTAIATCIVEHLLEHHFAVVFPRVEKLALENRAFADTLMLCSEFGESEAPANSMRLRQLKARLRG